MTSTWIHLLLLGSLCSGVIPAPLDNPYEEQDPELTGGYFEGDMDVVLGRNGLLSQHADGKMPQYLTGYLRSLALSPEGQSQLGQRLIMTDVDINRLNIMYKCPSPL